MTSLVLYCKSYRTDLYRLLRLAKSVQQFNLDSIPFYVSVPDQDWDLFSSHLGDFQVTLIRDTDILQASPGMPVEKVNALPGHLSQQIVKSEFWRLGISESYLCLDSDAVFIRPFNTQDFLRADGTPYSTLDEAHELLDDVLGQRRIRIVDDYIREADAVQHLFGRVGRRYSFGPFPVVWHRAVWQSLYDHFLSPQEMNFYNAIALAPIESRWYGEALLKYGAIELLPRQSIFKVYHYAWQYDRDARSKIDQSNLAKIYCGVILQSAWAREMDWPNDTSGALSKLGRRLRRFSGKI